ncbi:MAG TPA: hypothetical protein VFB49_07180 [Patescibacteria group bacterium]|nr:hypothetical protein [Patescibacteria group bacterium]
MSGAEPALKPAPARHPLVERVLAPDAPEALRLGAARGSLPIPLVDRLYAQLILLDDRSGAVAAAARDSLAKMSAETALPVLREPGCDPKLLDHFARTGQFHGEDLATIIAHPAVPNATLEALASGTDAEALSLIVTNEVRIINNPQLFAALRANAALPPDGRRRLAELERDFIGKEPIRLRAVAPEGPAATGPAAAGPAAPDLASTPGPSELPAPGADAAEETLPAADPALEVLSEEALQQTAAFQRIMKLNVAERQVLAMKGNGEERAILVRDTARIVSQAVLKNPRLTETEIAVFAAMRNVHEDILRTIASNRDWTKTYGVVVALIRNPKTPPGLTLQFLGRLGTRDLKIAAGDKNIPEVLRRHARELFISRTQPPKKTYKKGH